MFNSAFTQLLLIVLATLLVVAAVIDVRTFTISNRLNLAVALLAPVYWLSIPLSLWPEVPIQIAGAVIVLPLIAIAGTWLLSRPIPDWNAFRNLRPGE